MNCQRPVYATPSLRNRMLRKKCTADMKCPLHDWRKLVFTFKQKRKKEIKILTIRFPIAATDRIVNKVKTRPQIITRQWAYNTSPIMCKFHIFWIFALCHLELASIFCGEEYIKMTVPISNNDISKYPPISKTVAT